MDGEEILTQAEVVAQFPGVTGRWLKRRREDKDIVWLVIGGNKLRYFRSEIERYLAAQNKPEAMALLARYSPGPVNDSDFIEEI